MQRGALEERVEAGDRVLLREPRSQVRCNLRGRLAREILDRVEHLGLPGTLAAQLPHEDRRVRLQSAHPVRMAVDVQCRELDRPVETGIAPERAADVEADHERRPRSLGLFRGRARHRAQPQDQCGDATPHDAPPSTVLVLPVWKIGVLWRTWSSDRNGKLKRGLPVMTTARKVKPPATRYSTGTGKTTI